MADVAFDVAVLMGSQSPTVFDEYCSMHQGARRLRKMWEARCECGEPDCFRHGLNELSETISNDQELMLAFLDGLSGAFEPMTFDEFTDALETLLAASERKHGELTIQHLLRYMK